MKVSDYNTYFDLNKENEFLIMHGYTGAIDLVSKDIYECLKYNKINKLVNDDKHVLFERGYLTDRTHEEEKELFTRVSKVLHEDQIKKCSFTIIPSYNCNFRCPYCFELNNYNKNQEWLKKVMTKECVDNIFKYIIELKKENKKVFDITLFGGEPLLEENKEIINYILELSKNQNIPVSAITNGYNLEIFNDLISHDKVSSIQVTIDGIKEFHDKRRKPISGEGSFDKIVKNIELVLDKGIEISLRTNVDSSNIMQINKLMDFYNAKGWTSYKNFNYYFKSIHSCYVKDDSKKISDKKLISEFNNIEENKRYKLVSSYSTIINSLRNVFRSKGYALIRSSFCGATSGMYVIDPFGDVYPCWETVGNKNYIIGSLNGGKLQPNDNFIKWRNRAVHNIQECSECGYAFICGGGCPAHCSVEYDNIYIPYCNDFKQMLDEVIPTTLEEFNK